MGKRHADQHSVDEVVGRTQTSEKQIVSSAVRTDLVLSIEIMLISLAAIETDSWGIRLAILILVAIMMTVAVYGTVALLVKMDDVGFWLRRKRPRVLKVLGTWLVKAMPWVFKGLSVIGMVAMLWVGGHILLVNLAEVGVTAPYALVSSITHAISAPGLVIWVIDSAISAVFGLVWGAIIVAVLAVVARLRFKKPVAH